MGGNLPKMRIELTRRQAEALMASLSHDLKYSSLTEYEAEALKDIHAKLRIKLHVTQE